MNIPIYQIDAFAEIPFEGNPAAVIPLEKWLPDETLQSIAEENNLAETAFFIPDNRNFHIRWFTPNQEVKLCGHATLASAYVLFNCLGYESDIISFNSLSGQLLVTCKNNLLTLNFPRQLQESCEAPAALIKGLGKRPLECYKNENFMAVFNSEDDVSSIIPNHHFLEQLELSGIIVTAPSTNFDFVARFFAPRYGIPEDPVTGSAYTQLMPYWSNRIGKTKLNAKQISTRGGKIFCELKDDRVLISGSAVKYMEGTIEVEI